MNKIQDSNDLYTVGEIFPDTVVFEDAVTVAHTTIKEDAS